MPAPDAPASAQGEDSGTLQEPAEKTPSPLIDALDVAAGSDHPMDEGDADEDKDEGKLRVDTKSASEAGNAAGIRLVKVGQTTLHNPKGRSSWIGL